LEKARRDSEQSRQTVDAAAAEIAASKAEIAALRAALRDIVAVCANPDNPDFVAACTSGEIASRALHPSGGRGEED
jgi:hypothetical protein